MIVSNLCILLYSVTQFLDLGIHQLGMANTSRAERSSPFNLLRLPFGTRRSRSTSPQPHIDDPPIEKRPQGGYVATPSFVLKC